MKNIFENIKTQTVYYPIILFKRILFERKYLKIRICGYALPLLPSIKRFFFKYQNRNCLLYNYTF